MLKRLMIPYYLLRFCLKKANSISPRNKFLLSLVMGGVVIYPIYNRRPMVKLENIHRSAITDYVYMDLAVDGQYLGRILIGLYGRLLPVTTENFLQMCRGFRIKDKLIGYKNTKITNIIPDRAIIGGNLFHNNQSCTIFDRRIMEESYDTTFVQEGDVAMISDGPLGIDSNFMITLTHNPGFQQKTVVIGTVVKGMNVIRTLGSVPFNIDRDIRIINCGVYEGADDGPKSYLNKDIVIKK